MVEEETPFYGDPQEETLPPEKVNYADLEPDYYGPTWQRDPETGKFLLPEYTLGWDAIGWAEEWLLNPSDSSQPWRFTREQARFVLWWYAIDRRGRWLYRRGVLQRLKGWGKDPLLAVISLIELLGPCRFDGWDQDGNPKVTDEKAAWVQVAAVTKEQTDNTMTVFPAIISDALKARYRMEVLKELIYAEGGKKRLQALTSNYRTLEGKRPTFMLLNETHHWVESNGGFKMYETALGNLTKNPGGRARFLAITNAYLPGEESVAEKMRRAYDEILEGLAPDMGFLYDSIEAHPQANLTYESLMAVLPKIRGDAVWLEVEAIISDILGNRSVGPARQRRMWLNQIVADSDALYDAKLEWDPLTKRGAVLQKGDRITLGFDGGRSDDATALVAIRVSDGFVQLLHLQEKPSGDAGLDWIVDYQQVDSAVHAAFRDYKVVGFFADVKMWESYIADWGATYGEGLEIKATGGVNAIAWDMRGAMRRVTVAHELLMGAIKDAKLSHGDLDPLNPWCELNLGLRRHIQNARRRENAVGVSFGKESRESPRKVDAYAALLLAHAAYDEYRQKRKGKVKTGRSWAF